MMYRHNTEGTLWEAEDDGGDVIKVWRQGGGFCYDLPRAVFEADLVPVLGNLPFGPFRRGKVCFDEGPDYPCFLNDQVWNGWAMPYFTKDVALTLATADDSVWYDVGRDQIVWKLDDEEEPYTFDGEDIEVDGETFHVFAVGAGFFCWNVTDV